MARSQTSERQLKLLALLKKNEGREVTVSDICEATGWKKSTATTYLGKGLDGGVLTRTKDSTFLVRGAAHLSESEFLRLVSQSKDRQQFGHQFNNLIVRQLLDRSRTNVGLAVEIFNRASLENRLDAFVLLFITGWEQLLKAELEHDEPGSIFTGDTTRTGRLKTISLQNCLDRMMKPNDIVRRNIEAIRSLRDDAAHLLVSEVQPVATRFFQAGLTNYAERFENFVGEPALKLVGAGLLTLAMPYMRPEMVAMRSKYGSATANEIDALIESLEADARNTDDDRFAINIQYSLVLTSKPDAQAIYLRKGKPGEGVPGFIVETPKDPDKLYPYFPKQLAEALTERTGRTWSLYDVTAIAAKEKVTKGNNEYHYCSEKTRRRQYSEQFVALVAGKLASDPSYLDRARESYSNARRSKVRSRRS